MGHTNNNFIGAGHQYASVWDNGANLVDQLKVEIRVREIGLERFGVDAIRTGEPLSNLEYVLLPLYMHHRFQLRSAAQSLGGADYRNALKGDGQTPFTIIAGEEQRDALETILSTLTVDFLALHEDIVSVIPPRPIGTAKAKLFPAIRSSCSIRWRLPKPRPTSLSEKFCSLSAWPGWSSLGAWATTPTWRRSWTG